MSCRGLTGRTSWFVNVRGKVWRVSVCTACTSSEELADRQHALERGRKKPIKIRSSAGNTLCSQLADARKSSYLLPGCYHVLLILYPTYREPWGWEAACHLRLSWPASPGLLLLHGQTRLPYYPEGITSGSVAPFKYRTMPGDLI